MNSNPPTGASDIVPLSLHDSEGSVSHTHGPLKRSQSKNLRILGYPLLVFHPPAIDYQHQRPLL